MKAENVITCLAMATLFFVCMSFHQAYAQSTTTTTTLTGTWGDFTYADMGGSVMLTGYGGSGGYVVIPGAISGKPVATIGCGVFRNHTGVTGVAVPVGVTGINVNTFTGCTALVAIDVAAENPNYSSLDGVLYNKPRSTILRYPGGRAGGYAIPDSVTGVCERAFTGCAGLTSLTVPDSDILKFDSANPFSGCAGLTSITVDPGNPNYSSLDGVLFSKDQTSLMAYPAGRSGSYTIPAGVQYISYDAFAGCTGLTGLNVEEGSAAYSSQDGVVYNKDITRLAAYPPGRSSGFVLPVTVTSLGYKPFFGCSGLTAVTIPAGVTSISSDMFLGCTSLVSIEIDAGNAAYSSRDGAVYNKAGTVLKRCPPGRAGDFMVPEDVTSLDYYAFDGCSGLTGIQVDPASAYFSSVDGVLYNKAGTILKRCPPGRAGDFAVPGDVTSIDFFAFSGCTGLTGIALSATVTNIADYAFDGSSGLAAIDVDPDNTAYSSQDGAVYSKDGATLVRCPQGRQGGFSIPGHITAIDDRAFYGCFALSLLTIPSGVTIIGDAAFSFCSGLSGLTIPSDIVGMSSGAFSNCSGLVSFTIANGVANLGGGAFSGCTALASLTIPGSMASIGTAAFASCTGLASLTILDGVMSIGDSAFSDCRGLTAVTIPGSVASIGQWAFQRCSGLESLTIGDGVASIGGGAFDECIGLTSVAIPASVTDISYNPFRFCTSLTGFEVAATSSAYCSVDGVVYNKTMTALELYPAGRTGAFAVPDSVTVISGNAFATVEGLTGITLPQSLTRVEVGAFWGCAGLTGIVMPASVTDIEQGSFYRCSRLGSAYFYGNAPTMGENVFGECAGGFTVYCLDGAAGFANPWYGYPAAMFTDADADHAPDDLDNCPADANPLQFDADGDGIGDVCDPAPGCGGCGWPLCEGGTDTDGDTWDNAVDNCPSTYNSGQLDADFDGIGDCCDPEPGCGGCGQPACDTVCSQ